MASSSCYRSICDQHAGAVRGLACRVTGLQMCLKSNATSGATAASCQGSAHHHNDPKCWSEPCHTETCSTGPHGHQACWAAAAQATQCCRFCEAHGAVHLRCNDGADRHPPAQQPHSADAGAAAGPGHLQHAGKLTSPPWRPPCSPAKQLLLGAELRYRQAVCGRSELTWHCVGAAGIRERVCGAPRPCTHLGSLAGLPPQVPAGL